MVSLPRKMFNFVKFNFLTGSKYLVNIQIAFENLFALECRRMGLKEHQLTQYGLPIRPDFSKALPSKLFLRSRLGMNPTLPAVLLVGGGEGMGKLEQTVSEIAALGTKCQIVVICGRNAKLQNQLQSKKWGDNVELHAYGFVSNMHEFMGACDAVITKAGALHDSMRDVSVILF